MRGVWSSTWDPAGIGIWLQGERLRNTPVHELAAALGDVMSAATMGFGINMTDVREAVLGPEGVVRAFEHALQFRVNNYNGKTPGGVIIPNVGEVR